MSDKVIGIMGGMGPDSSVELYSKITEYSRRLGAVKDQDHLEIIISSVPSTPDRTLAFQNLGPDPVPELVRSAQRLQDGGADFIVIACNTAYYYLQTIQDKLKVPILDLMELTAGFIVAKHPGISVVGVMATTGTISARLFHGPLARHDINPIQPDGEDQNRLMEAIYGEKGIKALGQPNRSSSAVSQVREVAENLIRKGSQGLISGCTEIALALELIDLAVPVFNTLEILAEASVLFSKK